MYLWMAGNPYIFSRPFAFQMMEEGGLEELGSLLRNVSTEGMSRGRCRESTPSLLEQ